MAAKLLHTLADERPDVQTQIGCMTGIFQLYDCHQILGGRRITHKRLPPGNSHINTSNLEREDSVVTQREIATEMTLNEREDVTLESFTPSSSCWSTPLSSLDYNKTTYQVPSSFDKIISGIPTKDPVINQHKSSRFGAQPLNLQNVVKGSMYGEEKIVSLKKMGEDELLNLHVKHRDSPRPLHISKFIDETSKFKRNENEKMSSDLKESLRVPSNLGDVTCYYDDTKDLPLSSHEAKDRFSRSSSKDAHQFVYVGREKNQLSFESRDTNRFAPKLKQTPMFSLENENGSSQGSIPIQLLKNSNNSGCLSESAPNLLHSLQSQKRPSNVVAKLMGLETMPDSTLDSVTQLDGHDPPASSLNTRSLSRIEVFDFPRNSLKEKTSPRWKKPHLIMKPNTTSKFLAELSPWMQPIKGPVRTQNSFPCVSGEIEKRLENLALKRQYGKELRALKKIPEATQRKGALDTRKEDQASNFGKQDSRPNCPSLNQNPRLLSQQKRQSNQVARHYSSRIVESPIVILEPAKSDIPTSSIIQIDEFPSRHKLQNRGSPVGKKDSNSSRTTINELSPSKKKASSKNIAPIQSSLRPQKLPNVNNTSPLKSSSSVSPRLQQKKLELEKQSGQPFPPCDLKKSIREPSRQRKDLGFSRGKLRTLSSNFLQCDDQLSETSNESRTLSYLGNGISQLSDSSFSFDTKKDVKVINKKQSTHVDSSQKVPVKAVESLGSASVENNPTLRRDENGFQEEFATISSEQPSPVSVLDSSIYRDDKPSPVKQISNYPKGDNVFDYEDSLGSDQWNPSVSSMSNNFRSSLTSEINRKKLKSIDNLVEKLKQLNSHHDETKTDYIASLCENTNPDHRYISEIFLTSGLLLRDLSSSLTTFQLHPSGYPINPELFLVLEQPKTSNLLSEEKRIPLKGSRSKWEKEKTHRKLIFDVVNEILAEKLVSIGASSEPWLKPKKVVKRQVTAQKLLKELCFEIEQFRTKKSEFGSEEDDLKSVLYKDVMHRSESWIDFDDELSGVVLDVERFVFKDLVDKIVIGEATKLNVQSIGRQRLFA